MTLEGLQGTLLTVCLNEDNKFVTIFRGIEKVLDLKQFTLYIEVMLMVDGLTWVYEDIKCDYNIGLLEMLIDVFKQELGYEK